MTTIHTMVDLIRVLDQHPEWRAELRRLVLSDELLTLPGIVERLAEHMDQLTLSVDRLGEHMDQLTLRVDRLGEHMDQLTLRVDRLGEHMGQLTLRVDQLGERMDQLTAHVDRLAVGVEAIVEIQQRMIDDIGGLKGKTLEDEYRQRAPSYFGRLLRKGRVIDPNELWDALETALTMDELSDAILADVFVRGVIRDRAPALEVVLVVEVSFVVDRSDVERARRRCALLRRAGLSAIAVVAGERATDGARLAAEEANVVLVERHEPSHWDLALRDLAA